MCAVMTLAMVGCSSGSTISEQVTNTENESTTMLSDSETIELIYEDVYMSELIKLGMSEKQIELLETREFIKQVNTEDNRKLLIYNSKKAGFSECIYIMKDSKLEAYCCKIKEEYDLLKYTLYCDITSEIRQKYNKNLYQKIHWTDTTYEGQHSKYDLAFDLGYFFISAAWTDGSTQMSCEWNNEDGMYVYTTRYDEEAVNEKETTAQEKITLSDELQSILDKHFPTEDTTTKEPTTTQQETTTQLPTSIQETTTKKHEVTTQQETTTQPATTTQPVSNITMGQKNALKKAESYLKFTAFSYKGLIKQLEFEGFTNDECVYAADNCGANWSEQALKKAKSYLDFTAFSYTGLIEQLEFEEYTSEQAKYAVDNCGADWYEQAAKKAKSYLEFTSFSKQGLIEQLEFEGFTHEQAVHGVEANGY